LHKNNIIHRDLKLENILIDRQTKLPKIIDFGFSTRVKNAYETKLQFHCGTPIYMSPELATKKDYVGAASDVWALGIILFILITGKLPFYGAFEDDLVRKISQVKFSWPSNLNGN
jgi:serine/threonine protein kinase